MPLQVSLRPANFLTQWQTRQAKPLSVGKKLFEHAAAGISSHRQDTKLQADVEKHTVAILAHLHNFKLALTNEQWTPMVQHAQKTEKDVYKLRVCLRASNVKNDLPPRAVQFEGAYQSVDALAWANALDNYMLKAGRDPSPLIALWNGQLNIAPIGADHSALEQSRAEVLARDQAFLLSAASEGPATFNKPAERSLREARQRKFHEFSETASLEDLRLRLTTIDGDTSDLLLERDFATATQTIARLRAAVLAYEHPAVPMPPHPSQFEMAGNHWRRNRNYWLEGLNAWLDEFDERNPPNYNPAELPPPAYSPLEDVAPPDRADAPCR